MKAQIFSKHINGVLSTSNLYREDAPSANYGFQDIHSNLNMRVPIPAGKSARMHLVFTVPDSWNDTKGSWSWFGLITKLEKARVPGTDEVVTRGLYTAPNANDRVPITLQAVCEVPLDEDTSRHLLVRPQWAVSAGSVWIGSWSQIILTATTIYYDDVETPLNISP